MSLVADYGSDSEDYSEDENNTSKTLQEKPQISAKKEKSSGSVKFIVDLPKFEEEEDKTPTTVNKKPGRTSLFDMLPKPKNSSTKATTDLKPPNVSKGKALYDPHKSDARIQETKTASSPLASTNTEKIKSAPASFFPMDVKQKKPAQIVEVQAENPVQDIVSEKPAGPEPAPVEYTAASMYAYDETNPYYYDSSAYSAYAYQDSNQYYQEDQPQEDVLEEEAITYLMGRRAGRGQASAINITTINQQDQLHDPNMPTITSAGSSSFGQVPAYKVSGNQKRKHNIMFLAHQAKAREAELQDFYALNKKTKKETQSKYGENARLWNGLYSCLTSINSAGF
ncbi:hypothetical protein K493DRAFT_333924 [Basidiobolus meristosporus CBS 931.73]|uniref:Uncharacterized protein n=1 Tax=Basidiobolus meristosporus CBS 931.73 TaxID=1314790 RepID=A0A1Y1Z293_9FUNG|nr:hypothetical protein K493DRAFT_333924 [Basidiobolus meristosporus CBS 931.73]|eukprot:ORY04418.1 hypothetical protein K493DRAFT_333924 [Basidiobolus meristosporus CBS 931.73]